jgi:hypothetical protein
MNVYTYTEARQNLATLLDKASREGEVLIKRKDGQMFKVEPSHLQRVLDEGAVVEAAGGLIDHWGRRTKAGLLLMLSTRHNFIHLNEAWRVRQK